MRSFGDCFPTNPSECFAIGADSYWLFPAMPLLSAGRMRRLSPVTASDIRFVTQVPLATISTASSCQLLLHLLAPRLSRVSEACLS